MATGHPASESSMYICLLVYISVLSVSACGCLCVCVCIFEKEMIKTQILRPSPNPTESGKIGVRDDAMESVLMCSLMLETDYFTK